MTTHRENLHYEVRFKSDDHDHYDDFLRWLKAAHARRAVASRANQLAALKHRVDNVSGIVYTLFRKDCEMLASRFCESGIGAKPYHAGLNNAQRADHLQGWITNREGYDIIVATTAFGMGIDKEDVRFVVHWQIPKSFEGFYQEVGRAGRDGKASVCMLYYSREDRDRAASMLQREYENKHNKRANGAAMGNFLSRVRSLQSLIAYCENTAACRHKLIAQYFGEEKDPKCDWACDWHKDPARLVREKSKGLMSEEWCSTQREAGAYSADEYD